MQKLTIKNELFNSISFVAKQITENKKDIVNDPRPLMRYYKSDFGFHDAGNLYFVRPQYDLECYEMIQSIDELRSNATDIWKRYEDITGNSSDITALIP